MTVATSKNTANRNLDEYGSGTPASVWACLTTTTPNPTGDGTIVEPTNVEYVGYAEVEIVNNTTNWPAASGGVKTLATAFNFPPAGAGSVDNTPLTHLVFRTASGGGRVIDSLPLPAGTVITSGQALYFLANSVTISEA